MANQKKVKGVNTNVSYLTLRKIIGWCGLLLPWAVWAIALSYQPSISDYYYTRSGVLFTSILSLLGVFLISYRGYEKLAGEKVSDNLVTWLGGIFILIVAAIPTPFIGDIGNCPTPICHQDEIWGMIHFASAVLFFAVMGYMSAFHFVRGAKPFDSPKLLRNRIYRFCGYGIGIVLAIAGIAIFAFKLNDKMEHFIFWLEIVLLTLFGISWMVKGKALVDLGIQKEKDQT